MSLIKRLVYAASLIILIIGGLNWGLIALGGYGLDIVAGIFGVESVAARIVYGLVGLSALYQLGPSLRALRSPQP